MEQRTQPDEIVDVRIVKITFGKLKEILKPMLIGITDESFGRAAIFVNDQRVKDTENIKIKFEIERKV